MKIKNQDLNIDSVKQAAMDKSQQIQNAYQVKMLAKDIANNGSLSLTTTNRESPSMKSFQTFHTQTEVNNHRNLNFNQKRFFKNIKVEIEKQTSLMPK